MCIVLFIIHNHIVNTSASQFTLFLLILLFLTVGVLFAIIRGEQACYTCRLLSTDTVWQHYEYE